MGRAAAGLRVMLNPARAFPNTGGHLLLHGRHAREGVLAYRLGRELDVLDIVRNRVLDRRSVQLGITHAADAHFFFACAACAKLAIGCMLVTAGVLLLPKATPALLHPLPPSTHFRRRRLLRSTKPTAWLRRAAVFWLDIQGQHAAHRGCLLLLVLLIAFFDDVPIEAAFLRTRLPVLPAGGNCDLIFLGLLQLVAVEYCRRLDVDLDRLDNLLVQLAPLDRE